MPGGAGTEPAGDLGLWEAVDACRRAVDTATVAELAGGGDAAFHLRQVALEAVIERRIAVRAVISIHRALLAGARVAQVARATGLSGSQVAARWAAWADDQVRLFERTGLGMAPEEYGRVAAAITACGGVLPGGTIRADWPALPDDRM